MIFYSPEDEAIFKGLPLELKSLVEGQKATILLVQNNLFNPIKDIKSTSSLSLSFNKNFLHILSFFS